MSLIDLITIYFAGGAPLAVYYYLQNRHRRGEGVLFRLKIAVVFLFWMPYAVSLFLRNKNRRDFFKLDFLNAIFVKDSAEQKIHTLQKRMENFLFDGDAEISVFDFRETFERYVGLTLAAKVAATGDAERAMLRVAENGNVELGAICLHRRNRYKLVRHQTEARRDFLGIVERLADSTLDIESLQHSATEIVVILGDETARLSLEKMFAANVQTDQFQSVEYSEKDLWKPQEPRQPLRAETISTRS